MGLLQNFVKGLGKDKSEFKQRLKEVEMEKRIKDMIENKSKSSNQRELERYVKEQEEKEIKVMLDKIHKKQNADNWKGTSILKSQKSILHQDGKVLESGKSILKQKNIFLDHKANNPMTKQEMFFKW
jgi:hypothetical protein